jgi:signal transduction histidine kinase
LLFGIQNGDIGRPFEPRIATIDALVPRLRQCIERNETATFQVHRDGRYLLVQINLVADARQACTGAIVSCIDETSVRAAEHTLDRQLRQSQKMQAMGQLTGGIAHDFNNILASIMGHADLLARTLSDDEGLPAAAPRHLGEILRASERARSLIQQLLLYSHGGGGRPEPIEVPRLIEASLSMLRSVFPATIELRTHYPASLPCVLIDPVQANQLVMNLAINARDALQGRGRITLGADVLDTGTLRCASCHADHGGRYVRLRVSDNGPGLREGTLDRVFEPFFTTKDIGQGTGLGLSVVHGIVHEHGGHIHVSSGSDGATFDLLLPVLDTCLQAGATGGTAMDAHGYLPPDAFDHPRHATGDAPTVLIVDDEVPLAEMLRELLGIHGYRASACHDAEAALELLREESFGCVLSDLTMPGMSGTEFAAALLQVRPDVPLCLYTGNRLLVDEHSLARLPNVRALLDKPVETRTLLQTLRALCGHAATH